MAADPLLDTLFRATVVPAAEPATTPEPVREAAARSEASDASAAPIRQRGTRVRAGNAMSRTRTALLGGARAAVAVHGTRITMAEVAAAAGVAKATLYNHFRTRDAVLAALLQHEIDALIADVEKRPLAEALATAAQRIGAHPDVRALAQLEPATLAVLARTDLDLPGWRRAHEAVDTALSTAGLRGASLVLRWLASHLTTPGSPASIADDLAVLLAALPTAAGHPAAGHPAAGHPTAGHPAADDPLRPTA